MCNGSHHRVQACQSKLYNSNENKQNPENMFDSHTTNEQIKAES